MTGISMNLPEDLFCSLSDLARRNGQTAGELAVDVLSDYLEHERMLTAQIELAVEEAEQVEFATDEQVAVMRVRCWSGDVG